MNTSKITGLFIYPVKSMKGVALNQAKLTSKGLKHDRNWMVVRENGRFVTQREIPQMALVHTDLNQSGLVLSMPGHGSINIPMDSFDGNETVVKVWEDVCKAMDQGDTTSRWLTRALGSEDSLRLVRMNPGFKRPQRKPDILGEDTSTGFADASPFLLANEASLERLNSVLKSNALQSVPMDRFRPNIVVQGLEPFAEHKLTGLSGKNYQFKLCAPCQRCVITTINQETAEKDLHGQPFKTLQNMNPMPANKNAPAFAQYAILTNGDRQYISVGDQLSALVEL
jgi:uncharacterized protein YcbX